MCRASGVGARIELTALPVSAAFATVRARDAAAAEAALLAGDDYEVLAAIAPEHLKAFIDSCTAAGVPVTRVGTFKTDTSVEVVDATGGAIATTGTGWDHF